MNSALIPSGNDSAKTMSSIEIAELVESRHDSVKRTIERLVEKGVIENPPLVEISTATKPVKAYLVGKRDSFVVVAQLSPEFTARLVDRWQELEEAIALPSAHAPSLGYSKEVRLAAGRATSTGRAMGLEGNQLAIFVNKNVHTLTGHDYMAIGGITNLIAPQNEPLLTVTDVAKRLGMGARAVNALLTELGYQTAERDHKGRPLYEPTPKGEANGGVMVDSPKGNGVAGSARQLRWASKIVPALRADLDAENEVAA